MNEGFKSIIGDICKEKNILVKELSFGYILELEKDNKIRHLFNHSFPLNSQVAGKLADDKYASYEIFKALNIPTIEHKIIFNPKHLSNPLSEDSYWDTIRSYFEANNNKLVIKPNDGHNGLGVFLCNNMEEIKTIIHENYEDSYNFLMCPYYESITEYRTIYLNGECLLTYKKIKPFIIGDGENNIEVLIKTQLASYKIKSYENRDLDYIPERNEKYELSWKHNLCGGAFSEIVQDESLKGKIHDLVLRATKALNISFASVDILHTTNNELLIMEVNSNVYMSHFLKQDPSRESIVKDIYRKAIDAIFNK